jgi:ketosteroid isomerase-like protein
MMAAGDVAGAVYQRVSAGDFEGLLALCDQDIEWVVDGPASLATGSALRGRDGVRAFLAILGCTWRFLSFDPREFIAAENAVFALGEETGTDHRSKEPFNHRRAHVFDVEAEKVVRFREFLCHWMGDEVPPPMR